MPYRAIPFLAAHALLAALASAQANIHTSFTYGDWKNQRSFALVENNTIETFQGSWISSSPILRYVHSHPSGAYVIFAEPSGALHRLDNAQRMAEIQRMYAPIKELAAKQEAFGKAQAPLARQQAVLAHAQQPLAAQQRTLAQHQKESTAQIDGGRLGGAQGAIGEEQGDLGRAQGIVGEQQGEIGEAQGALGRKQGEIARANYKRMNALFDQCLADGSCPRVGG